MEKLIISDVHLRSERCNAKALLKMLKASSYKELIIVGDLSEKEGKFSDDQFRVVDYLFKNKEKVTCIYGNHDRHDKTIVAGILGKRMLKEYEWPMGKKRCLAIHGHNLDWVHRIFEEPLIDKAFYDFLWLFKKINFAGFNAVKWHDSLHDGFSDSVAQKAMKYAKKKGIDVIICGHTHKPLHRTCQGKNGKEIHYFNSGGWIKGLCASYITIDEYGNVKLHSMAP
ncbi:MAG: hypothetical protein A3F47_00455 [Candidatus Staskawiczbacteria bacterium RIFCSPHIGHO2_12_FULL_38_11]|uniref:Calcineurin-like phosphoesterase domain-containing protein n=1 Tax=Candidatus Staskawiczbacteria bacterium RIFCSPHIGHO2_12_FULL_38_11 TaxID=1802209 RepID=A0A1G2I9M0_9BACT|nr:MAG: hypothetical protein A3F47_00455 [Candidatus Staskawiczbacteria bacterium RIFCSPHIGHO2_12_FULL_38_11]